MILGGSDASDGCSFTWYRIERAVSTSLPPISATRRREAKTHPGWPWRPLARIFETLGRCIFVYISLYICVYLLHMCHIRYIEDTIYRGHIEDTTVAIASRAPAMHSLRILHTDHSHKAYSHASNRSVQTHANIEPRSPRVRPAPRTQSQLHEMRRPSASPEDVPWDIKAPVPPPQALSLIEAEGEPVARCAPPH